jgi:hypothetical protein
MISPWDAGYTAKAKQTREEQRQALTALTIRTLGEGIRDMIGSDRMHDEYWHETLHILARMIGGLPAGCKHALARAMAEGMIEQAIAADPELKAEADAVRDILRQRRHDRG